MSERTIVLIEFHPQPGREDTVRDGLARALDRSTDPHLLGGQVLVETGTGTVLAMQTWTSATDFQQHIHAAGGFDAMLPILTEPPRVRFLEQFHSRL